MSIYHVSKAEQQHAPGEAHFSTSFDRQMTPSPDLRHVTLNCAETQEIATSVDFSYM